MKRLTKYVFSAENSFVFFYSSFLVMHWIHQDFGNIFSTLLPGTSAKLEPPFGAKSALEGLEVKVAFRGKWKESLGELSGGYFIFFLVVFVASILKNGF